MIPITFMNSQIGNLHANFSIRPIPTTKHYNSTIITTTYHSSHMHMKKNPTKRHSNNGSSTNDFENKKWYTKYY
jgi:hypothetical protein